MPGLVMAGVLCPYVLRRDVRRTTSATASRDAPRAVDPILLLNPKAGNGKMERFGLLDACRSRGIEAVLLRPGDVLRSLTTFGERARMDSGTLGVVTVRVVDPRDLERLRAAERDHTFERFPGVYSWTAAELEVRSPSPVAAGIDGESRILTPPLRFRSLPHSLRIRVPRDRHGSTRAIARRLARGRANGTVL